MEPRPCGARVDEDLLTRLYARPLDQRLPCGQGDQGQGGGLGHGEDGGFGCQVVLVDGEEFGEGADAVLVGPGVDLVTHREAGDGGPDLQDLSGEVVAQDEGETVGHERLEVPVADPEVQRVDARRVDLHQDVVGTYLRVGYLGGAHGGRVTVLLDHESPHRRLRSVSRP